MTTNSNLIHDECEHTPAIESKTSKKKSKTSPPSRSFGRLLVKDTTHHVPAWIICLLAIGAAVTLGIYIHLWVGIFVAVVGCAIGIFGELLFGRGDHTVKVFEHGICTEKDGESQEMAFSDVDSFSCSVQPAQSSLLREFEMVASAEGDQPKKLAFETLKRSKEFNNVCRKLGEQLGAQLMQELVTVGEVDWGKYKIYQDSIEVPVRNGVFRSIEKVSFDRINAAMINYRHSQLWIALDDVFALENSHSPQIKLDTSQKNFFAGLHVFENLLLQHRNGIAVENEPAGADFVKEEAVAV